MCVWQLSTAQPRWKIQSQRFREKVIRAHPLDIAGPHPRNRVAGLEAYPALRHRPLHTLLSHGNREHFWFTPFYGTLCLLRSTALKGPTEQQTIQTAFVVPVHLEHFNPFLSVEYSLYVLQGRDQALARCWSVDLGCWRRPLWHLQKSI